LLDRLTLNKTSFCDLVVRDAILSRFAPMFELQIPTFAAPCFCLGNCSQRKAKRKLALSTVKPIEEVDVEAESNRVDIRLDTVESERELGTNLEHTIWLFVQRGESFWPMLTIPRLGGPCN